MATTLSAPAPEALAQPSARLASMRGPLLSSGFVAVVGVIVMSFWAQQYVGSVFVLSLTFAVVTAGMAIQIGFSQQVAFSQSVFIGLGAYGVAVLNADAGIPSLVAVLIVTIGSAIVAALLGRFVTKAPGLALAVATVMFPLIATGYLGSTTSYLGGSIGMPLTGSLFSSSSVATSVVGNGLIVVAVITVVVFVGSRILASDIGLELYTLGVSEGTASAMGVTTSRRKLELFVTGSTLAALGGALYAGTQLFVPASIVGLETELSLLMMLFIGGRRSVIGAVIGAFAIQYVQGASNYISVHILIIEGILITVILLVEPEGLAGIGLSLRRYARLRVPGLRRVGSGGSGEKAYGGMGAVAPSAALGAPGPPPAATPLEVSAGDAGVFRASWVSRGVERPAGTTLLSCRGVNKHYGGLKVLQDIDLSIGARGIVGLCGPNGAGKTTLLNVIGGSVTPDSGSVFLDEREITRLPPSERFNLGVSRTFQTVQLIRGRSVVDNVAVACLDSRRSTIVRGIVRSHLGEARERAMEALDFLGMADVASAEVSSLTLERQRMVELARAIACKPRLLLLDEPASGLSERQRTQLREVMRAIGEATSVVLIEHDLGLVASVAEEIHVLSSGSLVFSGDAESFKSSESSGPS